MVTIEKYVHMEVIDLKDKAASQECLTPITYAKMCAASV
jgi:hypothetical protein